MACDWGATRWPTRRQPSVDCWPWVFCSTPTPTPPGSTRTGKELVDGQVTALLGRLLATGDPVPLVDLQDRLWQLVEASFVLDDLDSEQLRRHRDHLGRDVRRICQTFADLGAVEVTEVKTVTSVHGDEQQHGRWVGLTPLGAAGVRELPASSSRPAARRTSSSSRR